jgi:hypothetical protein
VLPLQPDPETATAHVRDGCDRPDVIKRPSVCRYGARAEMHVTADQLLQSRFVQSDALAAAYEKTAGLVRPAVRSYRVLPDPVYGGL